MALWKREYLPGHRDLEAATAGGGIHGCLIGRRQKAAAPVANVIISSHPLSRPFNWDFLLGMRDREK